MKNIIHEYTQFDKKKCDCCGHTKVRNAGKRTYEISGYDLSDIVKILVEKHTAAKCECGECTEKTEIDVNEIDSLVERFYPGIGDVPEGDEFESEYVKTNFGGFSANVWLDASIAVQEALEEQGFKVN